MRVGGFLFSPKAFAFCPFYFPYSILQLEFTQIKHDYIFRNTGSIKF